MAEVWSHWNWSVLSLFGLSVGTVSLIVLFCEKLFKEQSQIPLLIVLTSIAGVLRFVPLPAGASAVFLIPILLSLQNRHLAFCCGSLAIVVTSPLMGGLGPWLPYQSFAAGFLSYLFGLSAYYFSLRGVGFAVYLMGFGVGIFYGMMMNIWFFPFLLDPEEIKNLYLFAQRYLYFYLTTSLVWDLFRAVGNVILLICFGSSILRMIERVYLKLRFERVEEMNSGTLDE